MRCHEARKRIVAFDAEADARLRRHLETCADCARFAHAHQMLNRDLAALADDSGDVCLPLSQVRTRVDAAVDAAGRHTPKEIPLMSTVAGQLKKRPRLSLSLGLAAAILLVITVIPFKFDHTVGYRVAIAGVDKDLAMDEFKVQELLTALGVTEADIELGECEQTCQLAINELRTSNDVLIVVAAFNRLGNCSIEEIREISEDKRVTLLGQARYQFQFKNRIVVESADSGTICEFVIQQLDSLQLANGYRFNIFSSCDGALGDGKTVEGATADGKRFIMRACSPESCASIAACGMPDNSDGHRIIEYTGDVAKFEPDETNEVALPDGYELGQNFPNPFNPITQITYRLAAAEQVRLDMYNINGQLVKILVDRSQEPGEYTVNWNADDNDGHKLASGVYFYRLTAGRIHATKKMTLLK